MGLFDKLFGKKQAANQEKNSKTKESIRMEVGDTFISTDDSQGNKIVRRLTDQQRELIDKSTIQLRTGQLYMHYWTENLVCADRNDPEWQNKVMFFWKAEEPFPKKSLPPIFETFKIRHFLFTGDTSRITLKAALAMPWFGMPGLGEKHVCEINGEEVTIPELKELNLVEYVELVELTNDNTEILTDRDQYMFLIDERITPFQNGRFFLEGKPISIDLAYSIGGIHIVRNAELEL